MFPYFKTSPGLIRLAAMLYVRFPLSLRNVEGPLQDRSIDVTHETAPFWWNTVRHLSGAPLDVNVASDVR
jgi:putative transposase